MKTIKYLTLSLLTLLVVFSACTSETETQEDKTITFDQLKGHWELKSAMRDGEQTSSLEGTFMTFVSADNMTCNFIGEEINADYTFKDNTITHGDQVYVIESLEGTDMSVSTQLMDFEFKLAFTKALE